MTKVPFAACAVLLCASALVSSSAVAADVQSIQALPASTSTQGLGSISRFFSQVFDQWKHAETVLTPPVSQIEQGVSQASVVIGTDGAAKITDAVVTAVGGDWFSVQTWGIVFKVQITGTTLFSLGRISQLSFLEISPGDHVDILGIVDPGTGIVTASTVNGKVQTRAMAPSDLGTLQQKIEVLLKRAQTLLSSMQSASSTVPTP